MKIRALAVLTASLGVGCLAPDRAPRESMGEGSEVGETSAEASAEASAEDESGLDPEVVLERALNYATELVQVNDTPLPGTHGDAALVNYFSAPENEQLFRTIDPEMTTQSVSFIEGAMFVKEHLDADGTMIGLTVMQKARPGYDPGNGDWWWARVSEGRVTHQGKVGFCADCHVMVQNTDYVYGVPLDNRR